MKIFESFNSSEKFKSLETACITQCKEIKKSVLSPQCFLGMGIGLGLHKAYMPLTMRIVKTLGIHSVKAPAFLALPLLNRIPIAIVYSILLPVSDSISLRQINKFYQICIQKGLSMRAASLASRVTSVFLTSLVYGTLHYFTDRLFCSDPNILIPQLVVNIFFSVVMTTAIEVTGELGMSMGMHSGNNLVGVFAPEMQAMGFI